MTLKNKLFHKSKIIAAAAAVAYPSVSGMLNIALADTIDTPPASNSFHSEGLNTAYVEYNTNGVASPVLHEKILDQAGNRVYCLEHEKQTPNDGAAHNVIGKASPQLINVLLAGWPVKSAAQLGAADNNEAEFATQLAVWVVSGSMSYGNIVWSSPAASQSATNRVHSIVDKLIAAKDSGQSQAAETKYSVEAGSHATNDTDFTYDYNFTVKSNKDGSSKLDFSGAPNGTKIIQNGKVMDKSAVTVTNNQSFSVKVPYQDVAGKGTFSLTGKNSSFAGYEYDGGSMQNTLVSLQVSQTTTQAGASFDWTPQTSRGHSTKHDDEGNALAGVKFHILDATGTKVVKDVESDKNGNIPLSGLKYGKYQLQEYQALAEYILDSTKYPFTVDAQHLNVNVGDIINKHMTPEIGTDATNTEDGGKLVDSVKGKISLQDMVHYNHLIVGKEYTVSGVLMDKTTKKPLLINGKEVRASKKFTATQIKGDMPIEFTIEDASQLAGKDIVAYEDLSRDGHTTVKHEDINDKNQTVHVNKPELKTTATNKEDGSKLVQPTNKETITDKVAYKDLIVGHEYEAQGILMDKDTNQPIMVDGKTVTGTTKFVAKTADGFVNVDLPVNATQLQNKNVVVFETLKHGDKELASHKDINDEGQTTKITNPQIHTTAFNEQDKSKNIHPQENQQITDTVNYHNLIKGKTYKISGRLMDKATGKQLVIDGKPVTAEKTFTAEDNDGSVNLNYVLNAKDLAGRQTVVFEDLYYEDRALYQHEDINDGGQTVAINNRLKSPMPLTDVTQTPAPKSVSVFPQTDEKFGQANSFATAGLIGLVGSITTVWLYKRKTI